MLTLRGGVPHHPSLVALWRDDQLTDFAVCTEGVEFKVHRVALASCSGYFLKLFESGMRDAADTTLALQGISPAAMKALLAFVYEGTCEIDEGLLTEVLEAAARLVVDALKEACADAIGACLAPSNALNVWRLANTSTLPALGKAAVEVARRGFDELPPQLATSAEVLMLVQDDSLSAKRSQAVFRWVLRCWEAAERPEAELLAVMKHVRFAMMEDKGDLTSAEPLCRKALEACRETLGDRHPDLLTSIHNLGVLLQKKGDLAAAEPLLREALEGIRETLGDRHPDTLTAVTNLGALGGKGRPRRR